MLAFFVTLQSFIADRIERDDKGATAVEYGLMVGLVAVAIITMATLLGTNLSGLFEDIANKVGGIVVP